MMKSSAKSIYPFFETIRIEGGRPQLLGLHQQRVDRVFKYFFPDRKSFNLSEVINRMPVESFGVFKCRLSYDLDSFDISIEPYQKKVIRKLIFRTVDLSYPFKFSDRSKLNQLAEGVASDEEVLIVNNGRIREVTFGNIIVRVGSVWYTPQYPIFYGIMRTHLLYEQQIVERDLFVSDLEKCSEMAIINAMLPLEKKTAIYHWE